MTSNSEHPRPTAANPATEPHADEQKQLVDQDLEDAVKWHLEHDPAFKNLAAEFDISSPPPPPSAREQTLAIGREWQRKRAERTKRERDKAKALRPAPKTPAERKRDERARNLVKKPAPALRPLSPAARAQIEAEAEGRVIALRRAVAAAPASDRRLRRMAGRELDYTTAWRVREMLRATNAPTSLQAIADAMNNRTSTESERQAVRKMLGQVKTLEEIGIWTPFTAPGASGSATASGT
ncbi:hypothetical protein ACFQI3_05115 [Hansschlegelia quercus]|uniref:Uncharacterized protein n=1 Tax=Hansschlegelia quercus TaxID=2528245 RepID=A0A4Q9GR10_9HYPH|nr:hypothetical protein [Hansschlegelia quercus]TBN55244.1 hypothetical protein EYR15_03705 [Hansschlegelia quercus]